MSFYYKILTRLRELDSSVMLGYIIANPQRMQFALKLLRDIELTAINPAIDIMNSVGKDRFRDYIKTIHDNGAESAVWVINELSTVKPVLDIVDYVVTDDVVRIKYELENLH